MFKNIFSIGKNKNLLSIILAFFVFVIVYLISSSNLLYFLDKKIQNTFYSIHNNFIGKVKSDELLVIEIDDKTLQEGQKYSDLDKNLGRFPFDRKVYVPIIENLTKAGAKIIAFDIIFAEKSNDESDNELLNILKKSDNVILGGYLENKGSSNDDLKKIFHKSYFPSQVTGFFNPVLDEYNHVVYSIKPFINSSNGIYDNFSISVLKRYYSLFYNKNFNNNKQVIDKNYYNITPYKKVPLAGNGKEEILINYIDNKKYKSISFIDIYDTERFENIQNYVDFKDKIILIGASASGLKDVYFTPNGEEPGVYTHANFINTVLTNNFLQYFNKNIEWVLIFVLIIFSVYFNLNRSSYVLIFSNLFLIIIFLIFLPLLLTKYTYLILNFPAELILSVIVSLTLSNIVKYLIESKSKDKLNKALSEYVSIDVANEILSGEGRVNLDGESKKIAIFFSDIEGFTSISEKFSAEELVGFLREYLSEMSNIIMDEKGFINKYEGDAIMALWGVFHNEGSETYRVCFSALEQQSKLNILNKKWKDKGFNRIKARIGIHYGDAIIGNIGSEGRKMEFTALGDNVNLASRLEGVNKLYGTYICVSHDVYLLEKDNFEFRYLDEIRVIGKENSVKIYELICLKGKLSVKQEKLFFDFKVAITEYQQMNFKVALKGFTNLSGIGDSASKTYIERCQFYIKNPPSKNWDGVWSMESK